MKRWNSILLLSVTAMLDAIALSGLRIANTVEVTYSQQLKVKETIDLNMPFASDVTTTHEIAATNGSLNAQSTPPATKVSSGTKTLSAGAATIDLTAAPGATINGNATTVDCSGLKVQHIKFVASEENTGRVLVAPHGTNGYNLFGAASCQVSLGPGESVDLNWKDTLADVDSTHKVINLTSAQATAAIDFIIVAG